MSREVVKSVKEIVADCNPAGKYIFGGHLAEMARNGWKVFERKGLELAELECFNPGRIYEIENVNLERKEIEVVRRCM